MANIVKVKALNNEGIQRFSDFLSETREQEKSTGKSLPRPDHLLSTPDFLEKTDFNKEIDTAFEFNNRYELGVYLVKQLGADFIKNHYNTHGLWTWLTLVWFEQLRPKKTSRHEHYIPYGWFKKPVEFFGTNFILEYRHAVRTPFELVSKFDDRARLFMSKSPTAFGDAGEELLSRPLLKSSSKIHQFLFDLYQDGSGYMRKNALDKVPSRAKAKNSKSGYGGVRRLVVDVLPRVKFTHDIDMMNTKEIVKVCGDEFSINLNAGKQARRRKK